MNVPKSFVPEKNLDNKTRDLLTRRRKHKITETRLYKELNTQMQNYIDYLIEQPNDFNRILYISDFSEKSRYVQVKKIIEHIGKEQNLTPFYAQEGITDYYEKLDINAIVELSEQAMYDPSIFIVYTKDNIRESVVDDAAFDPLMDRVFRIVLK